MSMKEGPYSSEVRELSPDESRLRVVLASEAEIDGIAAAQEARRNQIRAAVPVITTTELHDLRVRGELENAALLSRVTVGNTVQHPHPSIEPLPVINDVAQGV